MASKARFSYQRLRHEGVLFTEESAQERGFIRTRKFPRLSGFRFNRRRIKLKIPGLRRLRFLSRVKVSWSKTLKRLKNGHSHINDLFGGNYLVMQVTPSPFKFNHTPNMSRRLPPSSSYSLERIA